MTAKLLRQILSIVVVVVWVVQSGLTARAEDTAPRYIESFTGPSSAYAIDRTGARVPARPGLPLRTGDCVRVVEPTNQQPGDNANRMLLMIDGTEVRLDAANAKYCVGKAANAGNAALAAMARMFASLAELFQRSQSDYYTEHTATAQTRGGAVEPVVIYLLQSQDPRVAAGSRALNLAWLDGKPPFKVTLTRAGGGDGVPVTSVGGVTQRVLHLDDVALTAGAYRLDITDAAGAKTSARFRAVPSNAVPAPSGADAAALRDTSQPAALRETIYAGWLTKQGADWRFEAYQHVAGYAASSDLARALSFELSGGSK